MQALRIPGTSLTQSLEMQFQLEKALLTLPEVKTYFSRVGTAEVATDPMPPNISDGLVMLKTREEWPDPRKTKARTDRRRSRRCSRGCRATPTRVSQPIQLRFNELISGVRSDLGIKVYGDDSKQLMKIGNAHRRRAARIEGAEDVKVEQVAGLPVLSIEPNRAALYRYGLNVADVQDVLAAATGWRGGRDSSSRGTGASPSSCACRSAYAAIWPRLERLPIALPRGRLRAARRSGDAARWRPVPNQISRENGKRRLVVAANVRGRDLGGFVAEVQREIEQKVKCRPDIGSTTAARSSSCSRRRTSKAAGAVHAR